MHQRKTRKKIGVRIWIHKGKGRGEKSGFVQATQWKWHAGFTMLRLLVYATDGKSSVQKMDLMVWVFVLGRISTNTPKNACTEWSAFMSLHDPVRSSIGAA